MDSSGLFRHLMGKLARLRQEFAFDKNLPLILAPNVW